ncbi:MAG: ribonuclease Y [Magnetococcales bacterium]|nr:ribonuclease Y [Magnetococcales bacterium]
MNVLWLIFGVLVGLAIPAGYYLLQRQQWALHREIREKEAREVLEKGRQEAEVIKREAHLEAQKERLGLKEELENQYQEQKKELLGQQRRLEKKEEQLERKFDQIDQKERNLESQNQRLQGEFKKIEEGEERRRQLLSEAQKRLETVAGMSMEDARSELRQAIEEQARIESARVLKRMEEETRNQANKKAQEIITTAIQRFAGETVSERTVSVVPLPTEEMKGRIIGREGRNIRALETATGCDLIIDDTPEAVVISGFNPVRREVARRSLEELVGDGRIHPARIEEVVKKNRKVVANEIREAGEQAFLELGLQGANPEIVKLVGTLKFRTSYTQNVLAHSIEVGYFAGIMAEELGLDGNLARRCGLLHDIGKAVDHEVQGSHAVIGGELAKKYKEDPIVINSIWSHHFDIEPTSVYGPLTNAADALSAARPGARRENLQTYVKRLEDLEKIAGEFGGVEKAYAVQAGRELRVFVEFDRVSDEGALMIARDIAQKVENEMTYPGQIKVTVIREMRATEIAH